MAGGEQTYPSFPDLVSLGFVDGWEDIRRWNENSSVSNSQEEFSNIASGIRTLPSSATVITIVSSSAEDDPDDGVDAGTGIHEVRVYYLDANWIEQEETVELNGTANVTTTGTAIRFLAAHAETVGSSGAAVGNITFTIDGNPQSRILIGQNETRETAFACPDDKMILVRSVEIATGRAANVDIDIAIEKRDADTNVWYTVLSSQIYQNVVDLQDKHILLDSRDDLRCLGVANSTGVAAFITLHGWKISKANLVARGSNYAINGVPRIAR